MESVYVIILNYNHLNDLIETIDSFLKQDHNDLHLVVSDNNSADDSVAYIKQNYPGVHILQNKSNLGWSGGNNVGIEYAITRNADYILLSNNDIYFDDPGIISKMVETLIQYPEFGVLGTQENEYLNKNVCVSQGWIMYPKSKKRFNTARPISSSYPKKYVLTDNVSGCFMLTKSSLYKQIGLIDDNFFLYGEDTDFGLRAWNEKLLSVIDTSLIIHHKGSATAGNHSPLKMYYNTRNLIYIIRKHRQLQESYSYYLFKYYYDNVKIFFKILFYDRFKTNRVAVLKAHVLGLYHGVIKKQMGKYY